MSNKEEFKRFLIVDKGLQQITVKSYAECAKRVTNLIGQYPNHEKIKDYIYILYTSGYSYSHKTNTALALEKYMEFIKSPIYLGRQKKPKRMIKDTLSEGEITAILLCTKNLREKAIICLLAYSGIRNLELCNLKTRNLSITQNILTILKGKGLKDGVCEIPPCCTEVMINYLQVYPREHDDFLFTTLVKRNQMQTGDVRKIVKVVARRAKMVKRVYPHLFRHSMACNMLLRGANIITLQKQLRHSWLDSTLHYINSIIFTEKNNYQKHVPSYL